MLLLDNENYKLYHNSSGSQICMITFSGFGADEQRNDRFFMDDTAKKLDFEIFGIVAKYNCWYLNVGIDEIIDLVRKKIDRTKTLIMYGVSMGAFAALKYSKFIHPNYILAFAPQFSLDIKERNYVPSFYDQFYQKYMEGMNITEQDVKGIPYIFYDPDTQHEDGSNFELIKKNVPSVVGIKVFYTGHMVVSHLKGTKNFLEIVNFLHNRERLNGIIQSIRKNNKENIINILSRSVENKPYLTYKALIAKKSLLSRASYCLVENIEFRDKMIKGLLEREKGKEVIFLLRDLLLEKGLHYDNKNRIENYFCIYTANQDFLFFSVEKNCFFSAPADKSLCNIVLYCKTDNEFLFRNVYGDTKIDIQLSIEKQNDIFYAMKAKGKYCSVQPSGRVEWNRVSIAGWEKFIFVPLNK
ncbi:hypothetical protein K6W37_03360 [Acetobacter senegalensis]|uniref:hypothetical protein n=1 Tax=Acetobacter senegalensis TaxID=446692 RepID=UPI001EDBE2ED|nr:hypothetical protein [Acetobacter senegalensis]MCG4252942.1 hypothetical protein [Acetobacter senegalensis]